MTDNQIKYLTLQEQIRSNLADETETHRANLERESVARDTADSTIDLNSARTKEILELLGLKKTGAVFDMAESTGRTINNISQTVDRHTISGKDVLRNLGEIVDFLG